MVTPSSRSGNYPPRCTGRNAHAGSCVSAPPVHENVGIFTAEFLVNRVDIMGTLTGASFRITLTGASFRIGREAPERWWIGLSHG